MYFFSNHNYNKYNEYSDVFCVLLYSLTFVSYRNSNWGKYRNLTTCLKFHNMKYIFYLWHLIHPIKKAFLLATWVIQISLAEVTLLRRCATFDFQLGPMTP